jgi:hypothetical protein
VRRLLFNLAAALIAGFGGHRMGATQRDNMPRTYLAVLSIMIGLFLVGCAARQLSNSRWVAIATYSPPSRDPESSPGDWHRFVEELNAHGIDNSAPGGTLGVTLNVHDYDERKARRIAQDLIEREHLSIRMIPPEDGRRLLRPADQIAPAYATWVPTMPATDLAAGLVGGTRGMQEYGMWGYGSGSITLILLSGGHYTLLFWDSSLLGTSMGKWRLEESTLILEPAEERGDAASVALRILHVRTFASPPGDHFALVPSDKLAGFRENGVRSDNCFRPASRLLW